MKAITYHKYGSTENLLLEDIPKPIPKEGEVLIKMKAVSLNSSDIEFLHGSPAYVRMWGMFKPRYKILGSDIAGVVEAVGPDATEFKVGDEVFGDIMYTWGGLAEYVAVNEGLLIRKPSDLSFEQVAALPQASTVALQGLRDKGHIHEGEKILINGGGGSTGTFAIQLAKYFGAEVTAIDKLQKLELMSFIGADHVIDYTQEDFVNLPERYDLILDVVGLRSLFDFKQVLNRGGRYVMLGGPVQRILKALLFGPWISMLSHKKMGVLAHKQNTTDLNYIIELFATEKIAPVIDEHQYTLEEAPQAFQKLRDGKVLGKVVVTI